MPAAADKFFRLRTDIRPSEYRVHLTLHQDRHVFEGELAVGVSLAQPTREIVLHAADLELRDVVFVTPSKRIPVSALQVSTGAETVTLQFDEALPAGEGRIELQWSGRYCTGLRGLYMSGKMAVTQFQAADARRLFPCFDEPAFKARWTLSLTTDERHTVLANAAKVREDKNGAWRTHHFETTEPISTYLVALACGEIGTSPKAHWGNVPVSTWCNPSKVPLTAFAQETALAVLPRLQDYFGIPYAYGKVDQLGLSDFESGAMENVGLVTYREQVLLLDPAIASLGATKRIAEVITHELAHQWFGNWVTMAWWDDLWLNEAFATWMAFKIVDQWRPEWRIWLDFDSHRSNALELDALKSTHPVRSEILTVDQANEAFDFITYEKGGGVLRMIEGFLGETSFRDGIRAYMRKFGRANAVANDLWSTLEQASKQPVMELANTWIDMGGYPVLGLETLPEGLKLSQERFYSAPGLQSDELWPIPVVLKYEDAKGVHQKRVLFRERTQTVTLEREGDLRWVVGNSGSTGFYRVSYDPPLMGKLSHSLAKLEPAERASLLSDTWAMVRAGRSELVGFLELLVSYRNEADYAVLDELVSHLDFIKQRLVRSEDTPRFEAFVRELFDAQLREVGPTAAPQESADARLRRAAIIRAVGWLGRSPALLEMAKPLVLRAMKGDHGGLEPNLHEPFLFLTVRAGDASTFEALKQAYQSEQDPTFKRRYLQALTGFEALPQVQASQALLFDDLIQPQDLATFVHCLLLNPAARQSTWTLLQDRWDALLKRMSHTPMIQRRVVESFGNLVDSNQLEEVRAFLKAHPLNTAKQASEQTLEKLAQDVALREKALPQVSKWLEAGTGAFSRGEK